MPMTRGYMRAQYPLLMAPPDPPEFSNLSFSNLRYWGKFSEGVVFFLPYVLILKILRFLWRIQKWVKNTYMHTSHVWHDQP